MTVHIPPRPLFRAREGVTLTELLVVLGALGVLVAILIPSITGVIPSTQSTVAQGNLDTLNRAVAKFNQANWELVLTAADGTDDETAIYRSLQYLAPSTSKALPSPGAPYVSQSFSMPLSSSSQTYRAVWNGRMFQLAGLGDAGEGINLLEMQESGSTVAFESNYQPVGAR